MEELPRTIGNLEAKIDRLEEDVQRLYKRQEQIITILNQAAGGWKVMVAVGTVAGAIGAFVTKLLVSYGVIKQ